MAGQDSPQSLAEGKTSPFAALAFRDFRLFWSGSFISNIGSWMQITATSWLLYQMTNSPLELGINGIFRAVPTICLGVFGGTIIDRYDRKRLLLTTQTLLMLLAFLLGLLDWSGVIQVWHIYLLTFLSALVRTLDAPARQAFFPALVPRSVLPNAIVLNSLLWKGSVLVGPALAGIAISLVGTSGAFFANAVSFLAVVVALLLLRTTFPRQERTERFVKDLKDGVSYVLSRKTILGVMVMEATSSIFGLDQAMLTIFARDILRVGASGLGFLQSARGLGAVLGSAGLISGGQPRAQGRILFVSAMVYGATFALFGVSRFFPLSLFLLLVVGAMDAVWGATRNTILQVDTPDSMRGRVMGIFTLSNRGLTPMGQVETGFVVPIVGAREATFVGGIVVTVVTVVTSWLVPTLPRYRWKNEAVAARRAQERKPEPASEPSAVTSPDVVSPSGENEE